VPRTGAEVITEYLVREGVPYAVGLCGHGDIGLLDSFYDYRDELKTISVHHESAAGFIADVYYRLRHEPLATFTSCGPGSANLPVALGSAMMDDSAFLAITGNVATSQFNRGPFQETGRYYQADFPAVVRPYVKRSFQATRADQLPLMMRQAFSLMRQGRPGPVHLDVPLDVFGEETSEELPDPGTWRIAGGARSGASPEDLREVVRLLSQAERPVIVAGSGVEAEDASAMLTRVAELLQVPVATTPLGKSAIDGRSPLSLGAAGRNGTYQANRATRNADLVIALGTRFDDRSTSSWLPGYTYSFPATHLVHVHTDPAELGRNYPVSVGIAASVAVILEQLEELALKGEIGQADRSSWLAATADWRREWEALVAPHRKSSAIPMHPQRVLQELRGAIPDDAVIISDVGIHHNWIVQEWESRSHRSVLQSWGYASMGFGVAGIIGAHLAAPDRPAVAVVGDGGFLMLPSVVATAVQYDIPAIWVVWNNGGYISIRDQQTAYFGAGREIATTFENAASGHPHRTDFVAMSRSMGGEGIRVENPNDLGAAVTAALGSGRPTVIDVQVDDRVGLPSAATWQLPPRPVPDPSFGWPDPS